MTLVRTQELAPTSLSSGDMRAKLLCTELQQINPEMVTVYARGRRMGASQLLMLVRWKYFELSQYVRARIDTILGTSRVSLERPIA